MNDVSTYVGARARPPMLGRRARLPYALLLSLALLLAMTASANAAFSWPNEPAMVTESDPDARATFILDPGEGERLSRGELLAQATYYAGRGFNRNFLTWAPQRDDFHPAAGAEWAGCVFRGAGPTCFTEHFSVLRLGVRAGPVPSLVWGSAFIARACGNHSRDNGANPMPTISGAKYEDHDGDGARDSGEPGLRGWTIRLYRDGVHVRSMETNADGRYAFALDAGAGLGPGRYTVDEVPQSGWVQSSTTPAAIVVPYGAGATVYSGNDFGNYRPATVEGVKYEDMEADGDRDADDPLLEGWTIDLADGPSAPASDVTDASGAYAFTGLRPGRYSVAEQVQGGWRHSSPADGTHIITLRSGETRAASFGNYRPATIEGVKYEDMEADGDRDADDPLLEGWTIDLADGPSAPASDVTGASGAYALTGLRPGTYTVAEQLQAGWRFSSPADGARTVTVRSGDSRTADFGNYRPATIEGVKFDDHDVDRVRDAGEPGLADWTIGMTGGRSSDATDVTDADGGYAFGGLIPGTYTIDEEQKPGWRQSAPQSGRHTVTVRSGDRTTALFGNVCLGTADVRIADEVTGAPLDDVEVRLEQVEIVGVLENEPPLPRTTSATPTFAELLPGTYRVTAFLPDGVYTTDGDVAAVDGRLAVVKVITVRECESTSVPIKLFTASTGKVTGGMKMAVPGGFATAGFVFMTRKGQPEGSLEYQDHATGLNLHSERIEQIHVSGRHAWIGGVFVIDGAPRRFLLHLVDNGEPGTQDRFHLLVDTGYEAGENATIEGGNDQIHPPEHM